VSDTLIVLVPLLVAPVVLLLGFAGCASFGEAPPDAPPDTTPPPQTPPIPPPETTPPPAKPSYPATIAATPGLVAYWRLAETGGNVAADSGPNAASGALNGLYLGPPGAFALGQPGALLARDPGDVGASFDGQRGYVEVAYDARLNLAPALAFSVELWVRSTAAADPGIDVLISSREIATDVSRGFEVVLQRVSGQPPAILGRVYASATANPAAIKVVPGGAPDAWRHVVFTYDNGTLGLVVHVAGISGPFTVPAVTGAAYLDARSPSVLRIAAGHGAQGQANRFAAGVFDEVAVYAAALGLADAQAHFAAATVP